MRSPCEIRWRGARGTLGEICDTVARERAALGEKLLERGALLFRDVPIESPAELASIAESFAEAETIAYVGGDSPRNNVGGHVYTSTELPPDVTISLHGELSFRARYPRYLYFYCVKPAEKGGESLLGDARTVYEQLSPPVRSKFESLGVKYVHTYPGPNALTDVINRVSRVQRTWVEVFESTDRSVVEERCRALGMSPAWRGESLVGTCVRPASAAHWATGERVWFNQAHIMAPSTRFLSWHRYLEARVVFLHPALRSRAASYGDGSPIERRAIERVHDVLDAHALRLPLRAGDLLVIDNMLCMHGRLPFRGTRKILVAMTP
jgi:alpha-ketoglutarate-dependent taurine dioxygenase